jgi:ADP-heptose:LPS heptosyltransferase
MAELLAQGKTTPEALMRCAIDIARQRADLNALTYERFDASIDLAGNDRGAIMSRLVGAKRRFGVMLQRGHQLRRLCYTGTIEELDATRHETVRIWAPVSLLGVPPPAAMRMETAADPAWREAARAYLQGVEVLCFITASLPKKEWPLPSWAQFHRLAARSGAAIGYTGGHTPRERQMLEEFRGLVPGAKILDPAEPLDLLLAALAQLKGVVVGDTGPLHFAAGLGVPTLGLFGPTSATQWAPLGEPHVALQGALCSCCGHVPKCVAITP